MKTELTNKEIIMALETLSRYYILSLSDDKYPEISQKSKYGGWIKYEDIWRIIKLIKEGVEI